MGKVTTVGIDLAKQVFSIHAVDEQGHVVLRKTVGRARLLPALAQLPPCLVGMESCSGAHEWARQIQALGHSVRIMAARFVAPYRSKGKNDGNDAEAICEAVAIARGAVLDLLAHLRVLDERIDAYDRDLERLAQASEPARRLMTVPGVGPLTALATVASVGHAHEFSSGRQFAAWLGLVPRQCSTGGKTRLGRITKRGDAYLRTLLILGARAALQMAARRDDRLGRWALAIKERCGYHKAVVAPAFAIWRA